MVYWPALACIALVTLCGLVTALRKESEKDFWVVASLCFAVMGVNSIPEMKGGDSFIIFLYAALAFLLFFGFGLDLGSRILSWRKTRESLQEMTRDGLSND